MEPSISPNRCSVAHAPTTHLLRLSHERLAHTQLVIVNVCKLGAVALGRVNRLPHALRHARQLLQRLLQACRVTGGGGGNTLAFWA
jgi:hypothetical protein